MICYIGYFKKFSNLFLEIVINLLKIYVVTSKCIKFYHILKLFFSKGEKSFFYLVYILINEDL